MKVRISRSVVVVTIAASLNFAWGAPTHYVYDDLNRLVRVERPDGAVVTYTYDALGNRTSKTVVNDRDLDGVRDSQDCAPQDPQAWAVPPEVSGFATIAGPGGSAVVSWASVGPQSGGGAVYDVLRGSTGAHPVGSDPSEVCLGPGTGATTVTDPDHPSAGSGYRYLVRGRNACGAGTYGAASTGGPRSSGVCP